MITPNQIDQFVTSENLKTVKIITVAINIGILLLGVGSMVLYLSATEIKPDETEFLDILLGVLMIFWISTYAMASIIPRRNLQKKLKSSDVNLIRAFNTYKFSKLAFYEAPAFFGLVIIIIGITNGTIYTNSYLLLAVAPMIVLFVISISTFPTEYRVKTFLKTLLEELTLMKN